MFEKIRYTLNLTNALVVNALTLIEYFANNGVKRGTINRIARKNDMDVKGC